MSDAPHIPVMLPEVLRALDAGPGDTIIDATFGAGGYSEAILETGASVVAMDRDPTAIAAGQAMVDTHAPRLRLVQDTFSNLDQAVDGPVAGIVADVGVSSMQIDRAERGFSFQQDGPLDMRMGSDGATAADVVNHAARNDLTRIIGLLGDERQANRISAEICAQRERETFSGTLQLAKLVEKVLGRKQGDRIHPATRTFQALRIFVNRELEELAQLLLASERALAVGGRLAVVSFHSLEDRLVKRFLLDRAESGGGSRHMPALAGAAPTFELQKRNAVSASTEEASINPRSRSAKLRWGIRTDVPARAADLSVFGLPRLPDPSEYAA